MPPPLFDEGVEYADGTKATVPQMAEDVASFLAWTSEPELEERKRMGIKVVLYLLVLTGMLYALKRKIWSDVH
jgi:ubiquinol-cytochrome c reductase cytochrome c1 subunit